MKHLMTIIINSLECSKFHDKTKTMFEAEVYAVTSTKIRLISVEK